ncbi:hypothetical protein RZE82_06560 [Mollicutes bacterium LVI A0039]|nr:hypothetical protein RZE82_06560 [Mollicutes bacterium LVI A0039]
MSKKVIEYTIEYHGYRLSVLNVGATITEYSLDGHNVCLSYFNNDDYLKNELYAGAIVGRSSGRIKDGKFGAWDLPKNYLKHHNHHGNDLHVALYDVEVEANVITLTLNDPEGDYPGNAEIKVVYTLTKDGLVQEISATADKPTLFNFTNHSYFRLGDSVLNDNLQIDSNYYAHLDEQMFCLEDKLVDNTSFDFRNTKKIKTAFDQEDNGQFAITKFIDHPFKLEGSLVYSNDKYSLKIDTTSSYVVIYAGNYVGDCQTKLKAIDASDYAGICFETQERPGYTDPSQDFYSKTSYTLKQI